MTIFKRFLALSIGILMVIFFGSIEAKNFIPQKEQLKIEIGKRIFFDDNLSNPPGQSCATCHDPKVGWTGPYSAINKSGAVYPGAVNSRFGNRKPPSSAYAGQSPELGLQDKEGNFSGGMFWDGRATGRTLGDPLVEQALGPFLNPLEQNNPDKKDVVRKVLNSDYAELFKKVWNVEEKDWEKDAEKIYEYIGRSIAAFERSAEVNPFSSKFDLFWQKGKSVGKDIESIDASNWESYKNLGLSDEEVKGLLLFNTKGKCADCHVLSSGPNGEPPVFTDFTYDNLGAPKNPDNPFYSVGPKWNPEGTKWMDKGLGGFLENDDKYAQYASLNYGKHKVPTLRNVDLRPNKNFIKVYFHNGYFKSLEEVVNFYNNRDVEDAAWPPPEISINVNKTELGNLGLSKEEEELIVLFMKTLSDGYIPPKKRR